MASPVLKRENVNDLWLLAATHLSDEERDAIGFGPPNKLQTLTDLHALVENSKQECIKKRWKCTRKSGETVILKDVFDKIIRWIDIFKQVGDAASQFDSLHAALPWAAIRFVLQIAVNDHNKFATVIEDIAWITELLCRYRIVERFYVQPIGEAAQELERALVKFYACILVYLSKAKRYFEMGSLNRILKSGLLAGSEFVKYSNGISQSEAAVHQCMNLVETESNVQNHTELKELLDKANAPLQRMDEDLRKISDGLETSKRNDILLWFSCQPYIQHHKQTKQDVLPGTGQWLLSDPVFRKWKSESVSSILWLHGSPGSGKSKLVSIVIDDALLGFQSGLNPRPVFFYCSRTTAEPERSDPSAILASLVRQMSCPEPGKPLLQPSLQLYLEKETEAFASGPPQLEESCSLIIKLAEKYPLTTIVLDAFDECNPQTKFTLLKALKKILQDSPSLVKIFVSSRDNYDIVLRLQDYPNLLIESSRNSDDIATFVNKETERLIEDGDLLRYSNSLAQMKELVIERVIQGATGMFRWASLQLQYLCSFTTDSDVRQSLGRLPPDLNSLYAEIFDLLSNKPGERDGFIFQSVLSWLLCAETTLKSNEFLAAINATLQIREGVDSISKDIVLKLCNNLVIFDSHLDVFRFAHLSVREFLDQRKDYTVMATNTLAAEACLWNLVFTGLQHIETPLSTFDKVRALNSLRTDGFGRYSDFHWAVHYQRAAEGRHSGRLQNLFRSFTRGQGGTACPIELWSSRLSISLSDECDDHVLAEKLRDTQVCSHSASKTAFFIGCVFDISELLLDLQKEEIIEAQADHGNGKSALSLSATYGSCKSLRVLLKHEYKLPITEDVVAAAVGNRGKFKDVVALLLDERGDEVTITEAVVTAAAGNGRSGQEKMIQLFDQRIESLMLTPKLVQQLARYFDAEIMKRLLDEHSSQITITEAVIEAAASNTNAGKKVIALLFDQPGDEFIITETVLVAAAMNEKYAKEIIAMLFDRGGKEVTITEAVLVAAAGNCNGKGVMTLLFDQRGEEIVITNSVIEAAAGNRESGKEVMTLSLEKRRRDITITEAVVEAAARNGRSGKDIMTLLFDQRIENVLLTPQLLQHLARSFGTEFLRRLLDQRGNEITITEAVVEAAAINYYAGKETMALLLNRRGSEVTITEAVIEAAARNDSYAKEILAMLLDQRGNGIMICEAVLVAAARNRHGKEVMTLLLDQRGEEIAITNAVVEAAASHSYGKDVMTLLLDQRGNEFTITEAVLVAAAGNRHGKEVMALLFDRRGGEITITEAVIKAAARNYGGKEIMMLLLDQRRHEITITEAVVKAAAENRESGNEVMSLLFDKCIESVALTPQLVRQLAGSFTRGFMKMVFDYRGDEITISEGIVEAAAANNKSSREMMSMLLDQRGHEVTITEAVVKAAASNEKSGKELIAMLLDQRGHEVTITEAVVKTAASNEQSGTKVMTLLFDLRSDEVTITEAVLAAAAGNRFEGRDVMTLLFDQHGDKITITEAVVKAAAGNRYGGKEIMMLLLDQRGHEVTITEAVVKAAAGNEQRGSEVMTLLFELRSDEVIITEAVLAAAAGNCSSGKDVMSLLLDQRGDEIAITEVVLVAAARNLEISKEMMSLLLHHCGEEVKITEAVVKFAAENELYAQELMAMLIDYGGNQVTITPAVLVAVAGNWKSGIKAMAMLLNHCGDEVTITESILVAAAKNWDSGRAIMAMLLDQRGHEVVITEAVLAAAAGNGRSGREVLAMLLKQRGDEFQITEDVVKAAAAALPQNRENIKFLHETVDLEVTAGVIEAAATSGNEEILYLIEQWRGIETDKDLLLKVSRLFNAAEKGDTTTVRQLIDDGIPLDRQNIRGVTPLWIACSMGNTDVVEILLRSNAVDVNAMSIMGRTPLFWAAASGSSEIVQLLLAHGAEQNYTDKDGNSSLSIARLNRQDNVINILTQRHSQKSASLR